MVLQPRVAFDSTTHRWVDEAKATESNMRAGDPVPRLDGDILVDDETLARDSQDYGRIVSHRPGAVERPASASDVAEMVRYCRAHDIPVAPRGAGGSLCGLPEVEGGLVIEMTALTGIDVDTKRERAHIQAGALWSDVLDASLHDGLAPPVLLTDLQLTVGGTLATGGVGSTSWRHGTQADTVVELEVVTGTGDIVVCSPSVQPDLFYATLAGLGQCGIITRATTKLIRTPPAVRLYQLFYPDQSALTRDMRKVASEGMFDSCEGGDFQQAYTTVLDIPAGTSGDWLRSHLQAAVFCSGNAPSNDKEALRGLNYDPDSVRISELSYYEFAHRYDALLDFFEQVGVLNMPKPVLTVAIPDTATGYFDSLLSGLSHEDMGRWGVAFRVSALRRDVLRTPLFRVPNASLSWMYVIARYASDPADAIPANCALYETAREMGGTIYPGFSNIPMSPHDWQSHYGHAWKAFAEAKRKYDPGSILTPGAGVFSPFPDMAASTAAVDRDLHGAAASARRR